MVWARERTIPTERPPLVGEVSANFCRIIVLLILLLLIIIIIQTRYIVMVTIFFLYLFSHEDCYHFLKEVIARSQQLVRYTHYEVKWMVAG
jgi:hypothetical protein